MFEISVTDTGAQNVKLHPRVLVDEMHRGPEGFIVCRSSEFFIVERKIIGCMKKNKNPTTISQLSKEVLFDEEIPRR